MKINEIYINVLKNKEGLSKYELSEVKVFHHADDIINLIHELDLSGYNEDDDIILIPSYKNIIKNGQKFIVEEVYAQFNEDEDNIAVFTNNMFTEESFKKSEYIIVPMFDVISVYNFLKSGTVK